jgi:PAS domain S-box-containing protein
MGRKNKDNFKSKQRSLLEPAALLNILEDLEEEKKNLKKSEERYFTLIDRLDVGVVLHAPDTRILLSNPKASEILGIGFEQMVGKKVVSPRWKFVRPDGEEMPIEEYPASKVIRSKKPFSNYLVGVKRPDRKDLVWINVNSSIVFDEKKKIKYVTISFQDITEKKKAEEEIIKEKERAENYFDLAGNIILALDLNGNIIKLNKKGCEVLGYKNLSCELIGKNWFDLCLPKYNRKEIKGVFNKLIRGKIKLTEHYENPILTRKGEERIIFWYNTLINDKDGKVIGLLSSGDDITEKKKVENKLKESEEKIKQIFGHSPIAKFVIDKNHKIIAWNEVVEKLTGFSSEKMLGTNNQWKPFYSKKRVVMADLIVDKKLSKIPILYKGKSKKSKLIKGAFEGTDFFPSVGKNGTWLHFTATPLKNVDGEIIGAIETIEDVTERKNAEKLLVDSEEKFRIIVENAPQGIFLFDVGLRKFVEANPSIQKMLGYSRHEFLKMGWKEISSKIQPKKKGAKVFGENLEKMTLKGESQTIEWIFLNSKGEEILTEIHLVRLPQDYRKLIRANIVDIHEKKKWEDELKTLNQELENKVEERTEELQKANKELKELDAVKTDFQNLISHELKTPLTAMSAHLEILEDKDFSSLPEEGKKFKESLDSIKRNNNQLKILINNLLEITRIQARTFVLDIEKVDASEVAMEVINDLEALVDLDKIKIVKRFCKIPKISVDKQRLIEIFSNLITNSIKFTEKGEITITCKRKGKFVLFKISDTGIGIKKDKIPHLFEKFYQAGNPLSNKYGGSGLGLSITKQLLELQGGEIKVKSTYGRGSTFTIKLPIKYRKSEEYVSLGKTPLCEGVLAVKRKDKERKEREILTPFQKESSIVEDLFSKVNKKNGSKSSKGGVNHVEKKVRKKVRNS